MDTQKNNKNKATGVLTFDERSFLVDGQRRFLVSGEIHYSRAPRAEWPRILDASLAAGLNSIASYVFWNWHETSRDVYDFSGDRDLAYFLGLCGERKLAVLLRLGPYCCGEWNFGGYPPYLRDEPGIRIRTHSQPYLARVEKYFRHLAAEVIPHLATHGGPVVMVQIENEYDNVAARYGEEGQRYVKWLDALAEELGFSVPRLMCEAASSEKGAATEGAIATVNGFSITAERVAEFRRAHPGLPVLWTELWPGWYDTWGYQTHGRDPKNIARFILEFVGHGGCGWNYYMWYGGTNFGRTSMYLQTTNYGFGAPLDPYAQPAEGLAVLEELHSVLRENEALILGGSRSVVGGRTVWQSNGQILTLEITDDRAVLRNTSDTAIFDTAKAGLSHPQAVRKGAWKPLVTEFAFQSWKDPFPGLRPDVPVTAEHPVEQLSLTSDRTDYCWYATELEISRATEGELAIPFCGDFLRVYVNGKQVGHTPIPLAECRGCTLPGVDPGAVLVQGVAVAPDGAVSKYGLSLRLRLPVGTHRLEILASSLGLIKGDWMVSGGMETERKGIWDRVFWNGSILRNWRMYPGLLGEVYNLSTASDLVRWKSQPLRSGGLTWHRARFQIAPTALDGDLRLDLSGMGKGMLFVNGHGLGRYWLIEGSGFGNDEFWVDAPRHGLTLGPEGVPTQRYYRVPTSWLRLENELLFFEEEVCLPEAVCLEVRNR